MSSNHFHKFPAFLAPFFSLGSVYKSDEYHNGLGLRPLSYANVLVSDVVSSVVIDHVVLRPDSLVLSLAELFYVHPDIVLEYLLKAPPDVSDFFDNIDAEYDCFFGYSITADETLEENSLDEDSRQHGKHVLNKVGRGKWFLITFLKKDLGTNRKIWMVERLIRGIVPDHFDNFKSIINGRVVLELPDLVQALKNEPAVDVLLYDIFYAPSEKPRIHPDTCYQRVRQWKYIAEKQEHFDSLYNHFYNTVLQLNLESIFFICDVFNDSPASDSEEFRTMWDAVQNTLGEQKQAAEAAELEQSGGIENPISSRTTDASAQTTETVLSDDKSLFAPNLPSKLTEINSLEELNHRQRQLSFSSDDSDNDTVIADIPEAEFIDASDGVEAAVRTHPVDINDTFIDAPVDTTISHGETQLLSLSDDSDDDENGADIVRHKTESSGKPSDFGVTAVRPIDIDEIFADIHDNDDTFDYYFPEDYSSSSADTIINVHAANNLSAVLENHKSVEDNENAIENGENGTAEEVEAEAHPLTTVNTDSDTLIVLKMPSNFSLIENNTFYDADNTSQAPENDIISEACFDLNLLNTTENNSTDVLITEYATVQDAAALTVSDPALTNGTGEFTTNDMEVEKLNFTIWLNSLLPEMSPENYEGYMDLLTLVNQLSVKASNLVLIRRLSTSLRETPPTTDVVFMTAMIKLITEVRNEVWIVLLPTQQENAQLDLYTIFLIENFYPVIKRYFVNPFVLIKGKRFTVGTGTVLQGTPPTLPGPVNFKCYFERHKCLFICSACHNLIRTDSAKTFCQCVCRVFTPAELVLLEQL